MTKQLTHKTSLDWTTNIGIFIQIHKLLLLCKSLIGLIHFLFNTLGIAPVFLSLDFGDNGGEINFSRFSRLSSSATSTAGGAGNPEIKTNLSLCKCAAKQ